MRPQPTDVNTISRLMDDDEWKRLGPHMLGITREKVRGTLENMNDRNKQIDKALNYLQKEPRRYQWLLNRQFEPRMDVFASGMNLIDASWLADLTGSHLVTDRRMI